MLQGAWGSGLDRAAVEALAIEGHRAGQFSTEQVRQLIGAATRFDAEKWLGERGMLMNYAMEDLEADRRTLDRLLGKSA